MNKTKWDKWEPVSNLSSIFYFEDLNDDSKGLNISFLAEDNSCKIIFHFEGTLCLRKMDEGDLLRTFSEVDKSPFWTFFKVENSVLIKWFHEESYNIRNKDAIIHYVFSTPNEVIDILSCDDPSITYDILI